MGGWIDNSDCDDYQSNCEAKKTMKEMEMEKANALNCFFAPSKVQGCMFATM